MGIDRRKVNLLALQEAWPVAGSGDQGSGRLGFWAAEQAITHMMRSASHSGRTLFEADIEMAIERLKAFAEVVKAMP